MAKRQLYIGDNKLQRELTPEEAMIAIGIVTIASDEDVEEIESETLISILEAVDLFDNYEIDEIEEMFDVVNEIAEEEGIEALLNSAVEAIPNTDLREAALMTAMLLVSADDEIPEEEENFLTQLQQLLGVSDERYNELIDELFGEEQEEYDEEE